MIKSLYLARQAPLTNDIEAYIMWGFLRFLRILDLFFKAKPKQKRKQNE